MDLFVICLANLANINNHLRQSVGTLSEGEDGGHRADDHDKDGEEEYHVQDRVTAGDGRHAPVADLKTGWTVMAVKKQHKVEFGKGNEKISIINSTF